MFLISDTNIPTQNIKNRPILYFPKGLEAY